MLTSLFVDGGVMGRNPSRTGGTWAWVVVNHANELLDEASGTVTPEQAGLPTITNNYTELLAAIEGMEKLPSDFDGFIYTDSAVTLSRIIRRKKPPKFNGIPLSMIDRLREAQSHLGDYQVILLAGHPTEEDLRRGQDDKGYPVSKWNVHVDALCNKECENFLLSRGLTAR